MNWYKILDKLKKNLDNGDTLDIMIEQNRQKLMPSTSLSDPGEEVVRYEGGLAVNDALKKDIPTQSTGGN